MTRPLIDAPAFAAKVKAAYDEWIAAIDADNPQANPDAPENILLKHAFLAGWHAALQDVQSDP